MATTTIYNKALEQIISGTMTLATTPSGSTPPYKVLLLGSGSSYTHSKAHVYLSDALAAGAVEASGSGYDTGGKTLGNITTTTNQVGNFVQVEINDVQWGLGAGGSTITAKGAIIYLPTGNPATSSLLAYINFDGTVSSNASVFTIDFQTPLKFQN
jgi:hypothetical protein